MFKKIIFSLVLGLIAALYFAQNDQWVHDAISRKIKESLETAWDCELDFQVDTINIFVPSVTLKKVRVKPKDTQESLPFGLSSVALAKDGWRWNAEHVTFSSSWITCALSSMIGLHVCVDKADAHTDVQGNYIPLIHDHLIKMINGAKVDIPFYIKSLTFIDSVVRAQHQQSQADFEFRWSSESKSSDGAFKTIAVVHDGQVRAADIVWGNKLQGNVSLNFIYTVLGLKSESVIDCSADVHIGQGNVLPCLITGSWLTDHGAFTIESQDKAITINPLRIAHTSQGITFDAQLSTSLCSAAHIFSQAVASKVQGDCKATIHGELDLQNQKIEGTCSLSGAMYNDFLLADDGQITFNYTPSKLDGSLSLNRKGLGIIDGTWQWDKDKKIGSLDLHNKTAIPIPGFSKWMIDARALSFKAHIDQDLSVAATYNLKIHNSLTQEKIQSYNTLKWQDQVMQCNGQINRCSYETIFGFDPSIALKKLIYKDNQGSILIDIQEAKNETHQFQGMLDIELLRTLGKQFLQHDIQGEGQIALKGSIKNEQVYVDVQLRDGLIRLPQTYNFVSTCHAHVIGDLKQKNIAMHDVHIGLYRGNIRSPRIIMQWDDLYDMHYAYAPFNFESCLFNIKKDLFALFSGELAISKKNNQLAHAKGSFIIERSYVKENIYSTQFQKNLLKFPYSIINADKQDMSCDITIETKELIRVDTAFLQGNAQMELHIANTVRDPKISGSIELVSGSLIFPYKPLLITKASIYFMPNQLFDPLIELEAKNKIKNYTVGLHATGSLLNHHISLESSPALTDEQIIALLLVGSQEQSLNVVMPALLMQNLKSVLFDSEQSSSKLNSFFKSWLKPFKNINLVPSFSDQTGRGGLRGAVEIEISDRWRAMAQKNFSLSEDTRFEVEYSLSDDITLRGIRNERKDVATEVEMRWKFGK